MYVCICSAVTDRAIAQAARDGAHTLEQLSGELGVGVCCGMCRDAALEIVSAELSRQPAAGACVILEVRRVARHEPAHAR